MSRTWSKLFQLSTIFNDERQLKDLKMEGVEVGGNSDDERREDTRQGNRNAERGETIPLCSFLPNAFSLWKESRISEVEEA